MVFALGGIALALPRTVQRLMSGNAKDRERTSAKKLDGASGALRLERSNEGQSVSSGRGRRSDPERVGENSNMESSSSSAAPVFGSPKSSAKSASRTGFSPHKPMQNKHKSQEEVLAFTMEQSVLRQYEINQLRHAIVSRDHAADQHSKIVDGVLSSIAKVLGVEFTALAAAPASEGNNAPSSKDSCSESSTSPDSILTPKLLLKESYPDMWKIKQELIIDKIEDLKLKVQDGGQRIPIDRRTDGRVGEVDSLKGQIRYAFRKQLRKKRSLRLDESYSECSMVRI